MCKIWGEDAVFLQQAAHITEGIYIRLDDPHGLLQILMVSLAEAVVDMPHSGTFRLIFFFFSNVHMLVLFLARCVFA